MTTNHIVVTGYSGTGSTAVLDFLREFKCCGSFFPYKDYEDYFCIMPNSIFDLEWKLLYNNDVHRGDEALYSFYLQIQNLYKCQFKWFGDYERYVGSDFLKIVDDFINRLTFSKTNVYWYGRYTHTDFSIVKLCFRFFKQLIWQKDIEVSGRNVHINKKNARICIPYPEEFFDAAKMLILDYLKLISVENKFTIHDHLIWPQHINRISQYFDKNIKFIVVHRDLRDLFVLNSFFWKNQFTSEAIYPTDINLFCDFWKRIYNQQKETSHPQVLNVYFEDLIYNYEQTCNIIADFCGLDFADWTQKQAFFNPNHSIKNTQSFLISDEYEKLCLKIQDELPERCYQFPYNNKTSFSEMFI